MIKNERFCYSSIQSSFSSIQPSKSLSISSLQIYFEAVISIPLSFLSFSFFLVSLSFCLSSLICLPDDSLSIFSLYCSSSSLSSNVASSGTRFSLLDIVPVSSKIHSCSSSSIPLDHCLFHHYISL